MYRQLQNYRVAEELSTMPTEGFACPSEAAEPEVDAATGAAPEPAKVPKLLKTYLAIGARICSAPAWDREFGTIDFLTLLDLRTISSSARNRFLAPLTPLRAYVMGTAAAQRSAREDTAHANCAIF